ncbi:MAG TPA: autotransporter domain-containing protein [Xanthobacteraceae bacterium]
MAIGQRARVFPTAGAALAAAILGLLAAAPASAQFVCTTTPSDITCTNPSGGTAAGETNTAAGTNQNATSINNGTNNLFIATSTNAGGNATTINTGLNALGLGATTVNGGDAVVTNSGTNLDNGLNASTLAGGNATATNTATGINTFGILANANGPGNATATNAGINTSIGVQTETFGGGTATSINTGTNAGGISASTLAGGNAVATNTGNNTGGITAQTSGGFGNVTITNSGTSPGTTTGLTAAGGNVTVVNTGSTGLIFVETLGGGNITITNAGTNIGGIDANAGVTGGNVTVTNTGTSTVFISAEAGAGGNAIATNSGSSQELGAGAFGGGSATVINTGTNSLGLGAGVDGSGTAKVINTGSNAGGIGASATSGGTAIVVNSGFTAGTVQLSATGGGTSTLSNSGTISNFGHVAIAFTGGPDTLNLSAGSNITGAINLVGAHDTINFLSGNHNLTFNTLAGATLGGADPSVIVGNRAIAIDPTLFAMADKVLMDFTRGVSGMLDGIGGGGAASGPQASAFAPIGGLAGTVDGIFASFGSNPALGYANDAAAVFKAPSLVTQDGRAVWARGFGGARNQDAGDGLPFGAHTTFFGGAVGFDTVARNDLRFGVFVGGGESRLSLDGNNGSTNTDTAFGGLYGRWSFVSLGHASFLDFALHGGGSNNSTARTINNNAIAGGLEIATASYSSAYISPELKYGLNIPLWAQYTLTPSLRVRYVAGFFGGYTESGTTAPLTVANRTTQDIEERGELTLTRATPLGPDLLLTSVHFGAIGIERVGDDTVNTVVLGGSLPFVTPGKNDVAGVVGGAGFEWRTREGVSFFGAGEAIGFSDQSTVWSAKGGVRVAF